MNKLIDQNWYLLQDVNDTCEKLKLFETDSFITEQGPQISEWEPVEKLKHLQLLFRNIRIGAGSCGISMTRPGGIRMSLRRTHYAITMSCFFPMLTIIVKCG